MGDCTIVLVTISEHIGDHTVLGVVGRNLKDPGLSRTLIGDGVATAVSASSDQRIRHMVKHWVIGLTCVASVSAIETRHYRHCIALVNLLP